MNFEKKIILGRVTVSEFQICIGAPHFCTDDFSLKYGDFTIFKMADPRHLEFRGPIMDSLKSSCRTSYTSYRSSIETIALHCLVFEKITFLYAFWRQTDRRTDGQPHCIKAFSLSRPRLNNPDHVLYPLLRPYRAQPTQTRSQLSLKARL